MVKFGIFLLFSSYVCLSDAQFSVHIEQNLRWDGFHRNMTYDITFILFSNEELPSKWPYPDCVIGLHQPLPAGIYANPDELNDLRRSHRLNAITKKTNIELPAEQSEPNMVYVVKKTATGKIRTWIPLHARYHRAVRFGGYVLNEIEAPKLFMRCPDEKLDNFKEPLTPAKILCTGDSKKCNWKEVPVFMNNKMPIKWHVPVGDLNHYYPVAVVTAAAVVIGSVFLILSIDEYKFVHDY